MKKLLLCAVLIGFVVIGYYFFRSDAFGLSVIDKATMDYESSLPVSMRTLAYDKRPDLPIESWINAHATELNQKGFRVETPVVMRKVTAEDLVQCEKDTGAPCGWVTCRKITETETTIQYECGRWAVQYFLTNKDSSRIVVVESFGQDSTISAEEVLTAISFK